MGRLIGKRPDDTRRIAKRVDRFLKPGEEVLAGVHLQQPGTFSAEMQSGTSAAVGAAMDLPPTFPEDDPNQERTWRGQTGSVGIDEATAKRSMFVYLVITSSRLLILRRSRLLRWRPREVIAAWPLAEIERVEVPHNGERVTVRHGAGFLTFELPQTHKFLPQVYRDLPALHEQALAKAGAS